MAQPAQVFRSLYLSADLDQALARRADLEGVSKAELMRRLIADGVDRPTTRFIDAGAAPGCSFCGKGRPEVDRLVPGPGPVAICGACIGLAWVLVGPDPPADHVERVEQALLDQKLQVADLLRSRDVLLAERAQLEADLRAQRVARDLDIAVLAEQLAEAKRQANQLSREGAEARQQFRELNERHQALTSHGSYYVLSQDGLAWAREQFAHYIQAAFDDPLGLVDHQVAELAEWEAQARQLAEELALDFEETVRRETSWSEIKRFYELRGTGDQESAARKEFKK